VFFFLKDTISLPFPMVERKACGLKFDCFSLPEGTVAGTRLQYQLCEKEINLRWSIMLRRRTVDESTLALSEKRPATSLVFGVQFHPE
jgi:hypothetical protein